MNASTIEAIITGLMFMAVLVPVFIVGFVLVIPFCTGNCDTPSGRLPFSVLKVLAIVLFFAVAAARVAFVASREHFMENFDEYKCKPWFMPFVSQVNPEVSAADNFSECQNGIGAALLGSVTAPLVDVTASVGTGLNNTATAVEDANLGVTSMTTAVAESLERTQSEVSSYQAIIMYIFLKIKAMFDKSMATLFNFYYALISLLDMINIVLELPRIMMQILKFWWTLLIVITTIATVTMTLFIYFAIAQGTLLLFGPMGISLFIVSLILSFFITSAVFMAIFDRVYVPISRMFNKADENSYCCFAPYTPVVMADGTTRSIGKVAPGDVLQNGVRVRGVMRVESGVDDWYELGTAGSRVDDAVVVSGGHMFWDASTKEWVQVDSLLDRHAVRRLRPTAARPAERVCLVTDAHCIPTPEGWFADFQETDDKRAMMQDTIEALGSLNNAADKRCGQLAPAADECMGESQCGLCSGTRVVLASGSHARLSDIERGAQLMGGGQVIGTYRLRMDDEAARGYYVSQGVWLPSDQIYFHEGKRCWVASAFSGGQAAKPPFDGEAYHLITTSGYFHIRSGSETIKVRDFVERLDCAI